MNPAPVIIVGGGIAGLACALGMAKAGRPALVLEKAANLSEIGAGLQLGPNAVRALKWLGAWDAVAARIFAPDAIRIRDGLTGRELMTARLGADFARRFGEPYTVIHRADLQSALAEALRPRPEIETRLGFRVDAIAQDEHAAYAIGPGADRMPGAAIIGADGIRSVVRNAIAGPSRPIYRGHVLFRALLPAPADSESVNLWLLPGGHAVHYPVRGGRAMNLVATLDAPWVSEQWSEPASAAELDPVFARSAEELRSILAQAPNWTKWAAADLQPLAKWSLGRTTLAGDAAHAGVPFLAQGAAMALEDAVVLSKCMASSLEVAFSQYEGARRSRTARVVLAARRLGSLYHLSGPLRLIRNGMLRWMGEDRFLDRLEWIHGFDPTA